MTEELASHGGVVFGVGQPGMDQTALFSDGTSFRPDTLRHPPASPGNDQSTAAARVTRYLNDIAFPIWLADSRFVLDQIEESNRAHGPLHGRLDLARIGMLGWSFGGTVMRDYVDVPDALLADTKALKKYFEVSYVYVSSLRPKPTSKSSKSAAKRRR